jgi:hypothetical protein
MARRKHRATPEQQARLASIVLRYTERGPQPMTPDDLVRLVTGDSELLASYLREAVAPQQQDDVSRKVIEAVADLLDGCLPPNERRLHLTCKQDRDIDLILKRLKIAQEVEALFQEREQSAGKRVSRKAVIGEIAKKHGCSERAVRDALALLSKVATENNLVASLLRLA